jgi:hypothetical protein
LPALSPMTLHPDNLAYLLRAIRKVPDALRDDAFAYAAVRLRRAGDEPRVQDVWQVAGDVVRMYGAPCWHHYSIKQHEQRGGEYKAGCLKASPSLIGHRNAQARVARPNPTASGPPSIPQSAQTPCCAPTARRPSNKQAQSARQFSNTERLDR